MLLIIEPDGGAAELVERVTVWYGLLGGITEEDRGCDCVCHIAEGFVAIVVVHCIVGVVFAITMRTQRGSHDAEGLEGLKQLEAFFLI